jgi:ABC-2 type transport system ATP-binding protein
VTAEPGDALALATTRVSKRYRGSQWALQDVSIGVPRGSITALVGPNGAGKSTLIRLWAGYERATSGGVSVDGVDPRVRSADALMRLAYLSQTPSLYRDASVDDHLALARHHRRAFDQGSAHRYLDQFGIPRGALAGQLSGGQVTQVILAIALATRAPVLLLDEPMASLDPLARRDVLDLLIEEVRGGGRTILLSSHNVDDITYAADELIILAAGRELLASSVASAIETHHVSVGPVDGGEEVAALAGTTGSLFRVPRGIPTQVGARKATCDEVVYGYLRRGRTVHEPSAGGRAEAGILA